MAVTTYTNDLFRFICNEPFLVAANQRYWIQAHDDGTAIIVWVFGEDDDQPTFKVVIERQMIDDAAACFTAQGLARATIAAITRHIQLITNQSLLPD